MFDIGMAEMAVIGVVALIVVGPKDLPQMFRRVGQFVGKARGMARDFQRAMDQAADESGVGGVAADIKRAASMKDLGLDDIKTTMNEYKTSFEPKKVDAARERAARVSAASETNKVASDLPPENVEVPENSKTEVDGSKVVAKKAAVKKPAPKTTKARKTTTKKSAAEKPVAKKAVAKTSARSKSKV